MTTRHSFQTFVAGRAAFIVAALFLLVTLAACGSGDDASAQAGDDVQYEMGDPLSDTSLAAVVTSEFGTDTLTAAAFHEQFERVAAQVPQINADPNQARELRKNIVEDFVLRHALFGEADRLGIGADTTAISQRLQQIKGQFPSEEAYSQALEADGLTEGDLRENIGEMIKQEEMFARYSESVEDPTEAEITDYQESRAQEVRASHILFLVPQVAEEPTRDSIRQVAEAVLDSVQSGSDFPEMARLHSEDGTSQQGGDLGFFSRGQMVPPFEEAVYALSDSGDVTQDLIETQYGYHIIKLTGRRTGELMDSTQASEMIVRDRRQEAVEQEIDALREKVVVRVNQTVVDADLNVSSS